MAGSQLAAVMNGKKDIKNLSETAARSALAEAKTKLTRGQKALNTAKENSKATATMAFTTLEMHGTTALASFASGYRGPGGLNIGPVDVRFTGAGLVAWGLFDCLMGKGGHHQLAVGNGLLASYIGEQAMAAGAMLAEKSAEEDAPTSADTPDTPQLTVSPASEITEGESVREIILEPSTAGRRKPSRHRRKPPRHRRHRPRPQYEDEDED